MARPLRSVFLTVKAEMQYTYIRELRACAQGTGNWVVPDRPHTNLNLQGLCARKACRGCALIVTCIVVGCCRFTSLPKDQWKSHETACNTPEKLSRASPGLPGAYSGCAGASGTLCFRPNSSRQHLCVSHMHVAERSRRGQLSLLPLKVRKYWVSVQQETGPWG